MKGNAALNEVIKIYVPLARSVKALHQDIIEWVRKPENEKHTVYPCTLTNATFPSNGKCFSGLSFPQC